MTQIFNVHVNALVSAVRPERAADWDSYAWLTEARLLLSLA